ncbi:MAG: CPBP family intramembrane glutamic endopeptidase [Clostridium sp.]
MNLLIEFLKEASKIILFILVPWIMLISVMKKTKSKKQKKFLTIVFFLYVGITLFTQQILPTIVCLIYLKIVYSSNKYEEEKYYLRPLNKKKYKLSILKNSYTITIAGERFKVIAMSIIFKILTMVFSLWFIVVLNAYGIEAAEQEIIKEFLTSTPLKAIYLAVLMIVTAPILEEFIFRHIFYRGLKGRCGKILAAIISSIFFTILHYNLAGAVVFFAMGLFTCYIYEKHGYRGSVICHFIANLIALVGLLVIQ